MGILCCLAQFQEIITVNGCVSLHFAVTEISL